MTTPQESRLPTLAVAGMTMPTVSGYELEFGALVRETDEFSQPGDRPGEFVSER